MFYINITYSIFFSFVERKSDQLQKGSDRSTKASVEIYVTFLLT